MAPTETAQRTSRGSVTRGCVAALVALGFVALAFAIDALVLHGLEERVRAELATVLHANVAGLREWLAAEVREVESLTRSPTVRDAISQAVANPRDEAVLARLHAVLEDRIVDPRILGWVVTDADDTIVASRGSFRVGARFLTESRAARASTRVHLPFRSEAASDPQKPLMAAASPIGDEWGPRLFLVFDPDAAFRRMLFAARSGASGETYAFDRNGRLLSPSRFEPQLRRMGLLPRGSATSVLALDVRDPATGELTRGVRRAITGARGFDVRGYPDYRGIPVIGAWTFLPEHEFGVVTEIDYDEGFRLSNRIRIVFVGLCVGLGILAFALFAGAEIHAHVRSREQAARAELTRLGQYRLEEKIGEGGKGEVFRARHVLLRRPTAVKLLKPSVLGLSERERSEELRRFDREVQITSQLTCPNTIAIYDFGVSATGAFYYAMEYLEGADVGALVAESGPLSPERTIHLLVQACASLEEAHAMGLVHRDIKPNNLFVCERGGVWDIVKVLDFGLVRTVRSLDEETNVTRLLSGSPSFLAPELIREGDHATPASDIYALGCTAFFMLTGRDAFEGEAMAVLRAQSNSPPPSFVSLGIDVPDDLGTLVMSCLSKDPRNRPPTAAALAAELRACSHAERWTVALATAWWHGRGATLLERSARRRTRSHDTVDIDIESRTLRS